MYGVSVNMEVTYTRVVSIDGKDAVIDKILSGTMTKIVEGLNLVLQMIQTIKELLKINNIKNEDLIDIEIESIDALDKRGAVVNPPKKVFLSGLLKKVFNDGRAPVIGLILYRAIILPLDLPP